MKKISAYLTNYTAPSSGFSEGRLKDDPGDGTGSGITVQTHNDFLYALIAPIIKYKGALSETDESELASDVMDSIERAAGVANENVTEWANGTTYDEDDHVMYLGVQYVSMKNSNTGNNPIDESLYWLPCFNRDEAIRFFRDGVDIPGGFSPLHNKRDVTNYRQFFQWGKYNFGGASGRNFQAYGVHLDGQILTGDAAYVAIFGIGGAAQYPLLDVIAPDIAGTRTLLDTKGRVPRCADATGGSSVAVGLKQEDQFQGHYHQQTCQLNATGFGNYNIAFATNTGTPSAATTAASIITDVTNGTPRIGAETRMKNYSVGLSSILVFVEIV